MEPELERRSFTIREIRASEGDEPSIYGTAVVYNVPSEIMWDFREIIEPGFFDGAKKDDVRAFWNHNSDLILGRTKNGTLELDDNDIGLNVRIKPPNTSWGRDALTAIQRGDVDQMSFAFSVRVGGDEWRKDADGNTIRVLKRGGCERLYEVSPVAFPAYPQTSAAVRSKLEALTAAGQEAGSGAEERAAAQVRNAHRKRRLQLLKIK
jgi:HK97 family phage prohead protease